MNRFLENIMVSKKDFYLFIKECEFRFNHGTPSQKLKMLRKWCEI